jgi:hypothetical protein
MCGQRVTTDCLCLGSIHEFMCQRLSTTDLGNIEELVWGHSSLHPQSSTVSIGENVFFTLMQSESGANVAMQVDVSL